MTDERSNWLSLGIISFFGAIVANSVFPERRGIQGFVSATVVGVACGCTAGMTALAYEVHPGTQLVVTFAVGMLSYRVLNAIFAASRSGTTVNNNVYGDQQQNGGQNGGHAGLGWDHHESQRDNHNHHEG